MADKTELMSKNEANNIGWFNSAQDSIQSEISFTISRKSYASSTSGSWDENEQAILINL
jgi:hypothetical protein